MPQGEKETAPTTDLKEFKGIEDVLAGDDRIYGNFGLQEEADTRDSQPDPAAPKDLEQFGIKDFELEPQAEEEIPPAETEKPVAPEPQPPPIDVEALKKATEEYLQEQQPLQFAGAKKFMEAASKLQQMFADQGPGLDLAAVRQVILTKTNGDEIVTEACMTLAEQLSPAIDHRIKVQSLIQAAQLLSELQNFQTNQEDLNRQFYEVYPDLKEWRDIVSRTAESLQKQYPNDQLEEILPKIGIKARQTVAEILDRVRKQQGLPPAQVEPRNVNVGTGTRPVTQQPKPKPAPRDEREKTNQDHLADLLRFTKDRGYVI